ncbi:MAG: hypothetical protein AAFY98_01740 [Verrucomicrobiota bacterium]
MNDDELDKGVDRLISLARDSQRSVHGDAVAEGLEDRVLRRVRLEASPEESVGELFEFFLGRALIGSVGAFALALLFMGPGLVSFNDIWFSVLDSELIIGLLMDSWGMS